MSEPDATDAVDLDRIKRNVAHLNHKSSPAVVRAAELGASSSAYGNLLGIQPAVRDAYEQAARTLDNVENAIGTLDDGPGAEVPRHITREHAVRLEEQYDGPVLNLALMLLEHNRRKWLQLKPETNGAQAVKRHGHTQNQREWLNQLQAAWSEYEEPTDDHTTADTQTDE